jgi:hypothetical protein
LLPGTPYGLPVGSWVQCRDDKQYEKFMDATVHWYNSNQNASYVQAIYVE